LSPKLSELALHMGLTMDHETTSLPLCVPSVMR
jgi:hypothetical protein